jgi:hypothetical protein
MVRASNWTVGGASIPNCDRVSTDCCTVVLLVQPVVLHPTTDLTLFRPLNCGRRRCARHTSSCPVKHCVASLPSTTPWHIKTEIWLKTLWWGSKSRTSFRGVLRVAYATLKESSSTTVSLSLSPSVSSGPIGNNQYEWNGMLGCRVSYCGIGCWRAHEWWP